MLSKQIDIMHILSWQVFAKGVDKDLVVLMAARASRLENQDAIDAAIVSMLADPKEVMKLFPFQLMKIKTLSSLSSNS